MRKRPLILLALVGVVLAVAVVGAFNSDLFSGKPAWGGRPPATGPALQFRTAQTTSHPLIIEANGIVIPDVKATVASKREGDIHELLFAVGQTVEVGQPLARIDDRLARIDLADRQARLRKAEAESAKALSDHERHKDLFKSKVISKDELDAARLKADTMEADVQVAQEAVRRAEQVLENHTIRSPISGVILQKLVDVGSHARVGTPAAEILHLDHMQIEVGLTETRMLQLQERVEYTGLRVEGRARALEEDAFRDLKIEDTRISLEAVETTRTFPVFFRVDNRGPKALYPGMSVRLRIHTGLERSGIFVPASAVLHRDGKTYLWIDRKGRASLMEVVVGRRAGAEIQIRQPLVPGERVIIGRTEGLKDGESLVKPKPSKVNGRGH